MRRAIILDTETTGLDPDHGHRIIEIAGIEWFDYRPTGRYFHYRLDPQRPVDPEAAAVHGITWEDLAGCPTWAEVQGDVLSWLDGSQVVAHYAPFDVNHIDAEIQRLDHLTPGVTDRAEVVCTKELAKGVLPDLPSHRLDSLLDHYEIDRSRREAEGHGALLDCQLLAEVYERLLEEGW